MNESKNNQVWSWSSIQRKSDFLMNKAYISACSRLVKRAFATNPKPKSILDVGAGSGLVLRFIAHYANHDYSYTGVDINKDGLDILKTRAEKLKCHSKVNIATIDITTFHQPFHSQFDMIFSNFCLYTIKDSQKRSAALTHIKNYLKPNGTFHIALPTEHYTAERIALQCLKDEIKGDQNFILKTLRSTMLVPYQWHFILKPIANKVHNGTFLSFSKEQVEREFADANLRIDEIAIDYGGCGYHIHGHKAP